MSNRLCIEPTEFKNVRSNSTSFGFRAYDDADQTYDNTFESIPDDDLEFLKAVVAGHQDEHLALMLDSVVENHKGVYIGDSWYKWDQIKDIVAAADGD